MSHLTITQRAILRRRHGITVTREVEGVAYCVDGDNKRREYAIDHLQHLAAPGIGARLCQWILKKGVA